MLPDVCAHRTLIQGTTLALDGDLVQQELVLCQELRGRTALPEQQDKPYGKGAPRQITSTDSSPPLSIGSLMNGMPSFSTSTQTLPTAPTCYA